VAAPAYTLDVLGDVNFTGTIRSNGTAWVPLPSILSATTSSVLYVGGKHHTDVESTAVVGSVHSSANSVSSVRLTNSGSTNTVGLSGGFI
jgi:hypothetical protein